MACKRNLIDLIIDKDGFFEPQVDTENCVNCGLCRDVCSFINTNDEFKAVVSGYGAWSNNEEVRSSCSSGGIAYEISRYLLEQGFKICAVRYNPERNVAEHYIADNLDNLEESKGSKYIQSYTIDAFREIDINRKYLIIGTPCQISSIRRAVRRLNRETNFVLIDFFCHGVPSKLIWDKYFHSIKRNVGKIRHVSWRNKSKGWHDSWVLNVKGTKRDLESFWTKGDKFYTLFLSDTCLNKACYDNCRFKGVNSHADIRLGDAWGKVYGDNEKGVSIALSFSELGESILKECGCYLESKAIEELTELQMRDCPKRPELYNKIMDCARKDKSTISDLYRIIWRAKKYKKFKYRVNRIFDLFNTIFNK